MVQKQLREDWGNREYIEVVAANIRKIADFLNSFGSSSSPSSLFSCPNSLLPFPDLSCRTKLSTLNEKLGKLERKIEFLEARVTKNETLN